MAHEITNNDSMISVHERPWHGLGIVLDEHPSAKEAQRLAKLDWTVRKEQVYYRQPKDGVARISKVPASYVVVRNDINTPLGIVGDTYEPFQNNDMFNFMQAFCDTTQAKIETAGSLRGGQIIWALAKNGTSEYIKEDPVDQYFLFKNSFDGTTSIEICFTDVRVVCNNTLTSALRRAKSIWRIRHSSSLYQQLEFAKDMLFSRSQYMHGIQDIMQKLANIPVTEKETRLLVSEILRKQIKEIEEEMEENDDDEDITMTKQAQKALDKIMELCEAGAGTEIPGVRGTAYGVLQACTEYADHYKRIRPGDRDFAEARFESLMMGTANDFKLKSFQNVCALMK